MIKVLPSTNPVKEDKLIEYTKSLIDMGVEYLHCDVMDGKFVANRCLELSQIEKVRNNCNILLDVHLMVEDVLGYVERLIKIQPNIITIHYEAPNTITDLNKALDLIHKADILVGLSVKPSTNLEVIKPYLDKIDMLLLMSVEPGKSGQKFLPETLDRITTATLMIGNRDIFIEVDGGINADNAKDVIKRGAKFLVMGSAFFKSDNKKELLHSIDKHYKNK